MLRHSVAIGSFSLIVCAAGGCVHPRPADRQTGASDSAHAISQEDLRDALNRFEDYLEENIKQAAGEIDSQTQNVEMRRATLLWRMRIIPACQSALKVDDPLRAFIDCWTLTVRMRQYLADGEGRTLFGEWQGTAIAAARRAEAEIERVGTMFLPADQLPRARDEVQAFARQHPLRAGFADATVRAPAAKQGGVPSALSTVLSVPLAPFRTFEGIDRGATAIHEFANVAARFTDVVEEIPEAVRWQLELLLLDLNQNPMILAALATLGEVAANANRIVTVADKLPERLRDEATRLLNEIDAKQNNLQATLDRAEKTAATVERALERVDLVANAIEATGWSVADAGQAWGDAARTIGQTVHDMYDLGKSPRGGTATLPAAVAPGSPVPVVPAPSMDRDPHAPRPAPATAPARSREFDIKDYRDTADAVTGTARELQALAVEIRAMIESQRLSEQIRDVDGRVIGAIDLTSARARSLTDHVAWRAAQIAVLIFVLAVGYRIIAGRWAGRTFRSSAS